MLPWPNRAQAQVWEGHCLGNAPAHKFHTSQAGLCGNGRDSHQIHPAASQCPLLSAGWFHRLFAAASLEDKQRSPCPPIMRPCPATHTQGSHCMRWKQSYQSHQRWCTALFLFSQILPRFEWGKENPQLYFQSCVRPNPGSAGLQSQQMDSAQKSFFQPQSLPAPGEPVRAGSDSFPAYRPNRLHHSFGSKDRAGRMQLAIRRSDYLLLPWWSGYFRYSESNPAGRHESPKAVHPNHRRLRSPAAHFDSNSFGRMCITNTKKLMRSIWLPW